jgi:hypothetical protein
LNTSLISKSNVTLSVGHGDDNGAGIGTGLGSGVLTGGGTGSEVNSECTDPRGEMSVVSTVITCSEMNVMISGITIPGVSTLMCTFGLGVPKNEPSENSDIPLSCKSPTYLLLFFLLILVLYYIKYETGGLVVTYIPYYLIDFESGVETQV